MNLFKPPEINSGPITPRPYQEEALDALDTHMRTKDTHPCVVVPTGGGKSILIAWAIQEWKREYPPFRVMVLAQRKELVQQNSQELVDIWPTGDIGVYSAGLKRRDIDNSIMFASIDSVYNKAGLFPSFDVLIIDEAHRIPARGEGKYRTLISECEKQNENLRVIGFTATPYRMGCGPICHKNHILNEVCYEVNVGDLIGQGYLCRLRSKVGDVQPDTAQVRRNSGGDYITKSLAEAVDTPDVVRKAVRSAISICNAEHRKSIVFFCVDVKHCKDVAIELRKYGIEAPHITAQTPEKRRDEVVDMFKRGYYRAICNVNVYTEGFNAKRVDCIVLLRPTLSQGLYVQMVGRGLRLHPKKEDCLVLDYARCIDEHGPIDCIDQGEVKLEECRDCGDIFSRAVRVCPHCGWEIPKQEIERAEAEEKEKRLHDEKASQRNIIGNEPEEIPVDDVALHRHRKPGKPDSLRVEYRCGMLQIREWICLDHGGFAERKARMWWARRFSLEESRTVTVDSALEGLFTEQTIRNKTKAIIVKRQGKLFDIIDYKLN